MKYKKTLSTWLTNRFLLIIRNEENFAEKRTFSFTHAKLIVFGITFLSFLMGLSFYIILTFLKTWYNPKYSQLEINRKIILLSAKVDSLTLEDKMKDTYIMSFRKILEGTSERESDVNKPGREVKAVDMNNISSIDKKLRDEIEAEENKSNASILIERDNAGSRMEMYELPAEGIVASKFDLNQKHWGIDLKGKAESPVKAIADGTIILSDWTEENGFVMMVQHKNEMLSIYKNNIVTFKKVGSFIKSGEIIGLMGNFEGHISGPGLHFELWKNGEPVNPAFYVSF